MLHFQAEELRLLKIEQMGQIEQMQQEIKKSELAARKAVEEASHKQQENTDLQRRCTALDEALRLSTSRNSHLLSIATRVSITYKQYTS